MAEDIVVDEEGKVVTTPSLEDTGDNEQQDNGEAGSDERLTGHEEEGEGEGEGDDDAPNSDPEREAIRQRRRDERRHKKEAQREREEALRRELESERNARDQLEQRLSVIERKSSGMEASALDTYMKQASDAYAYFKNQIAAASAAGDHASIADATEKMMMAKDRYQQLDSIRRAYQQRMQQPAPLDPRIASQAQRWLEKHSWYDPDGGDEDSFLASKVDERLASEGWNPVTPQYWEELDARLKKYLPHRYKTGYNKAQGSRSPVAGSGRDSASNPSGSAYRLSSERVKALREAGIEPGSREFAEAVKYYKEYDQQLSAAK